MPEVIDRVATLVRHSTALVFDQSRPAGRLAVVHGLQATGSGLVTISLAGSLFFSISPKAAEGHVLLYLVLTIAPFAIVGPALSPLLDRGRRARRAAVAIAAVASAVASLGMARNIGDLWLFPEAFALLVLAKLYNIARAAIVPEITGADDDLAALNAHLAVIASLAGFLTIPIGVLVLKISGAPWVLRIAALVFVAEGVAALRLPKVSTSLHSGGPPDEHERGRARYAEVAGARRDLGLPLQPHLVTSSVQAVSAMRATVGFVAFFLAFELRRTHAASWWFGVLILASGVGSLVGSAVVPRLRRRLNERQIIAAALWTTFAGALVAGILGGRIAQCALCFVVGVAPMAAKPALDSIVQRNVAPALLGRMFGRLETRLQLLWVLAALVAVIIPFPLRIGDAVVAVVALVAALTFASGASRGHRSARSRPRAGRTPSSGIVPR